jgi:hypothetical protein
MIDLRKCVWTDHPKNPLIEPPGKAWLIADPTVLTPDRTPDGRFHLFANSVGNIHHYTSGDGLAWEKIGGPIFRGLRPFVFVEDGYHIFYERIIPPRKSHIAARTSKDLKTWSDPIDLLRPQFSWEGRVIRENGNACLVKHQGKYLLYHSAGWVWLRDCYFMEPKFISLAVSDSLLGPYTKREEPLIGPSKDVYWRNLGAGSIKVIPPSNGLPWFAFNNGIYVDAEGKSRSEIHLLESDDGLRWNDVHGTPILAPEPGWKRALVYAMHLSVYKDEPMLYYNARDGWFRGRERIGLAIGRPK